MVVMVGMEYYEITPKGYMFVPAINAESLALREAEFEINCRPVRKVRSKTQAAKV